MNEKFYSFTSYALRKVAVFWLPIIHWASSKIPQEIKEECNRRNRIKNRRR